MSSVPGHAPLSDDGARGTTRDRAHHYLAALAALAAAVVAVEACLVAADHLLAAQIIDAVLVLLLVNIGPRDRSDLSKRAEAALAALRALALVPLIRVVALALPMRNWSEAAGVLLIALPIGLAAMQLAPFLGIARRQLVTFRLELSHLYAAGGGAALGLVAYLSDRRPSGRMALPPMTSRWPSRPRSPRRPSRSSSSAASCN
jgi:hypothetical protein